MTLTIQRSNHRVFKTSVAVLGWITIVVFVATCLIISTQTPVTAQPPQVDITGYCKTTWDCLPAWRWGGIWDQSHVAPAQGNPLFGAVTAFINWIASLPFMIAKYIWWATLWIIKATALNTSIDTVFDNLADDRIQQVWKSVGSMLGHESSGWHDKSLWLFALIAVAIYSIWITFRPRTGAMRYHEVNNWYSGLMVLLGTCIPLLIVWFLVAGTLKPSRVKELTIDQVQNIISEPIVNASHSMLGTPLIVDTVQDPNLPKASQTTTAKFATSFDETSKNSVCGLYVAQLYNTFLEANIDPNNPDPKQQKHIYLLPAMISKMWESTYLFSLGTASYGTPTAGYRAMCFTLERGMISENMTPKKQRELLYKAMGLDYDGGMSPAQIKTLQPDSQFHPTNGKEEIALKILSVACAFKEASAAGPTVRSTDKTKHGPQSGYEAVPPNYLAPYGINFLSSPDLTNNVSLYEEWTGIRNRGHNALSSNVCAAWMFPHITRWGPLTVFDLNWNPIGLKSNYIKNHAVIDEKGDVGHWKDRRATDATNLPSEKQQAEVGRILKAIYGYTWIDVFIFGFLSIGTALLYFKAFGGLALGSFLSIWVVVIIIYTLPLTLFCAAFPIPVSISIRKRLLRLFIAASLSYALFHALLMLTVAISFVMYSWVHEFLTGASGGVIGGRAGNWGGGIIYALVMALVPYLTLKTISMILGHFGMAQIMTMRGAAQFTSGLSAAGIRIPSGREFASTFNKELFKPGYQATRLMAKGTAGLVKGGAGVLSRTARRANVNKKRYNKKGGDAWVQAFKDTMKETPKRAWDATKDARERGKERGKEAWRSAKDSFDESQSYKVPWSDRPVVGRDPNYERQQAQLADINALGGAGATASAEARLLRHLAIQQANSNNKPQKVEVSPVKVKVSLNSDGRPDTLWSDDDHG